MPTATGRETTTEREARQRAEEYAAMRAAMTDDMRTEAAAAVPAIVAGGEPPTFRAGEELALRAGRRTITVDEGEVRRLALADAVKAAGLGVLAHTTAFGLFAGRSTIEYGIRLAR